MHGQQNIKKKKETELPDRVAQDAINYFIIIWNLDKNSYVVLKWQIILPNHLLNLLLYLQKFEDKMVEG